MTIKVHPTGSNPNNQSTNQTHAKDGGDASIVPKAVQEKVPESVERYLSPCYSHVEPMLIDIVVRFPTLSTTLATNKCSVSQEVYF
jgi:hypothetical protein